MISCLSDDAKNVNKKLGKLSIRIHRKYDRTVRFPWKIHIVAEMLTRDPRVLPQEVIDAARKSRKRQPHRMSRPRWNNPGQCQAHPINSIYLGSEQTIVKLNAATSLSVTISTKRGINYKLFFMVFIFCWLHHKTAANSALFWIFS